MNQLAVDDDDTQVSFKHSQVTLESFEREKESDDPVRMAHPPSRGHIKHFYREEGRESGAKMTATCNWTSI